MISLISVHYIRKFITSIKIKGVQINEKRS
jgi:hypothetical protein